MLEMVFTVAGKDETQVDKLRSILAQLEYKHQIDMWHSKGIPFKDYLYVPEVHPITGLQFCEREDEAHILKVRDSSTISNVLKHLCIGLSIIAP